LEFKYPNSKKLYLAVKIFQLLYKYNKCTYNDTDKILKLIFDEIAQLFENTECDKADIIQPMNHVEPYC